MTDPLSRRTFLGSTALAATALSLPRRTSRAKKILVLGGTGFLGPHFVRAALAGGHEVTLFNRGKTNPGLFADLETLHGDREKGELGALTGRKFDCVVDNCGYVPAHVAATAKLFADVAQHYTFVSSISVYPGFGESADELDETAAVGTVEDEKVAGVDTIRGSMPYYGPLKARCEAAAEAAMPGRVANIRPGLIVGPGDSTDRFTWWPVRIDRGGDVLAPGDRDGRVQVIDVRDLAQWMLHCLDQQVVGVFNADGFAGPVTMAEFLGACKGATRSAVTLHWASEEFLTEHDVKPWMEMPMWLPRAGNTYARNGKAIAQGLTFRPLGDTIRDTLEWAKTTRGDKPFARTGVAGEKEQRLVALMRAGR